MGRFGRATCTVHLISDLDHPGRKQMYHYIREAKRLLSWNIYCALSLGIPEKNDDHPMDDDFSLVGKKSLGLGRLKNIECCCDSFDAAWKIGGGEGSLTL